MGRSARLAALLAIVATAPDAGNAQAAVGDAYEKYVAAQRSKTDKLSANGPSTWQWVSDEQIGVLTKYLQSHIVAKTKFALCHGTRSGRETTWFRTAWPEMQVWGTELSPVAAATAAWTMAWDFHLERPEWLGQADFVYTNALDHSFVPQQGSGPHAAHPAAALRLLCSAAAVVLLCCSRVGSSHAVAER